MLIAMYQAMPDELKINGVTIKHIFYEYYFT